MLCNVLHAYTLQVLANFRQLLWFWSEYYTHRGRDRIGVEFSCARPFAEWHAVVQLLCADDSSSTSLVSHSVQLPSSPYSREPRRQPLRFTA
jgi:hypothetical protein